ncbi:MAG: hypothetical protein QXK37_03950 [Candidatus Woesearchaeota archaeon]
MYSPEGIIVATPEEGGILDAETVVQLHPMKKYDLLYEREEKGFELRGILVR